MSERRIQFEVQRILDAETTAPLMGYDEIQMVKAFDGVDGPEAVTDVQDPRECAYNYDA